MIHYNANGTTSNDNFYHNPYNHVHRFGLTRPQSHEYAYPIHKRKRKHVRTQTTNAEQCTIEMDICVDVNLMVRCLSEMMCAFILHKQNTPMSTHPMFNVFYKSYINNVMSFVRLACVQFNSSTSQKDVRLFLFFFFFCCCVFCCCCCCCCSRFSSVILFQLAFSIFIIYNLAFGIAVHVCYHANMWATHFGKNYPNKLSSAQTTQFNFDSGNCSIRLIFVGLNAQLYLSYVQRITHSAWLLVCKKYYFILNLI